MYPSLDWTYNWWCVNVKLVVDVWCVQITMRIERVKMGKMGICPHKTRLKLPIVVYLKVYKNCAGQNLPLFLWQQSIFHMAYSYFHLFIIHSPICSRYIKTEKINKESVIHSLCLIWKENAFDFDPMRWNIALAWLSSQWSTLSHIDKIIRVANWAFDPYIWIVRLARFNTPEVD